MLQHIFHTRTSPANPSIAPRLHERTTAAAKVQKFRSGRTFKSWFQNLSLMCTFMLSFDLEWDAPQSSLRLFSTIKNDTKVFGLVNCVEKVIRMFLTY